MRFTITAAADPDAPKREAAFDDAKMAEYMRFNEEMHLAGVLIASEGLNPHSKGARVAVVGGRRVLLDGPFAESKELVGGFYLIEVASLEEAIAWALRCPTGLGTDDVLTVLPMTNADDLPAEVLRAIQAAAPTWSAAWSKPR
jgi:hypothetical protein